MKMRGIAILAAFAALATGLVAGAGAAGTDVPTGGTLVYAGIDPRDGMSDIFVRLAGGTASVNITDGTGGSRKDVSPAFSPNGSKITFVRSNAQGAQIMVVNPDGSGLVNVTPTQLRSSINLDPSWSGDGHKIVFTSNVDGNYDLYWIDVSTASTRSGVAHRLTKTEAPVRNVDPAWAPTGKYIAFSRSGHRPALTGNSAELFQLDVLSLQAARLTKTLSGRGDVSPVYSPDSRSIVFSSDRSGNDDVYLLDVVGTKSLFKIVGGPARDYEPAFAPDGTAIVFVSTRSGKGATELFAQNLIGLSPAPAQPVQLTFDGLDKSHPGWGATATQTASVGAPKETPLPGPTAVTASPAAR
jgi:TolB protein